MRRLFLLLPLMACCFLGSSALGGGQSKIQLTTWTTADGLPSNKVMSVAVQADAVWIGTDRGLVRMNRGDGTIAAPVAGLPHRVVTALAVDGRTSDLWAGTLAGLARVSAGRVDVFDQRTSGLSNNVVYGVVSREDSVWIATAAGLSRYQPWADQWSIFDTENNLMHEPWIYSVAASPEGVYAGIWGGGVVQWEAATGRFREHRDPDGEMEIDLFRNDGLVHDVVSAVAVDGPILWAGTYFGLSRYDGRAWMSYSASDSGLAGDFINDLAAGGGVVWIATDQGISRFDGKEWRTWRESEGLPSNTVYDVAMAKDGSVWMATAAGLCRAAPVGPPSLAKTTQVRP